MPFAVYCGKCRANYGNTTMAAAEEHSKQCPGRPLYKLNHGGLTKFGRKWFEAQKQQRIKEIDAQIKRLLQTSVIEVARLNQLKEEIRRAYR